MLSETYLLLPSSSSPKGNVNLKIFIVVAFTLTKILNFHLLALKLGANAALVSTWLRYMTP
jgi:hypothetical protein